MHLARAEAAPAKATRFQLVFMAYAAVCGGAYGLEGMIAVTGPGLALVILLVLPLLYAMPIALACAELTARHPVEGGYYRWVRLAFGDLAGCTAGWLVWLTMFATNASFAVLFVSYLEYFLPGLPPPVRIGVAMAMVWLAVLLNYRGIRVVGTSSVLVTTLVFVPFIAMTLLGFAQWRESPVAPFSHPETPFLSALSGGVLMAMWLYGGFEKLTVNAEELDDPVRDFPVTLAIVVPLCALSYILPTLAALAARGDWQAWGDAYYVTAAAQLGGPWLGAAMASGALVSNIGLLTVTILSHSRLPMVLAEDGFFPRLFERRHARFGTPVASLIVTGAVLSILCILPFAQLVAAAAIVQSLSYLLIYAALFKLRARDGAGARTGFRIGLGTAGLALLVAPSAALVSLVIWQGMFPAEGIDTVQLALIAALLGAGPLTYLLASRRAPVEESRPWSR